jgi:hypothetical protein
MNKQHQPGYFCLIQFCPDLGRLEVANVGVLVFCPKLGFLRAKVESSNSRIIKFFGRENHDWKQINSFKTGIVNRIENESKTFRSLDDLKKFIDSRANLIQISEPRPMTVVDPSKDLDKLFSEFLGTRDPKEPGRSLKKQFWESVQSAGIERKIKTDITVHVPVMNRDVEIPFGYQNSRLNLITPVKFKSTNIEQSFRTACKYGVEGRSLYENSHSNLGDLQLVVLAKFQNDDHETIETVRRVFDDGHVKLYKSTEVAELLDEIRRTGKDLFNEN